MQLPDDAMHETIIRHKRPTMRSATSTFRTHHHLASLFLYIRKHTYTYVLGNSRKTDYYPENVSEAEFIVTSDFVSVIFRRESSSRSRTDELSLCARHRVSYILIAFPRIILVFNANKPLFYQWKHKFARTYKNSTIRTSDNIKCRKYNTIFQSIRLQRYVNDCITISLCVVRLINLCWGSKS